MMKKIVFEHYPAWKLPTDLRGNIPLDAFVTVTIEDETKHDLISPEKFPPLMNKERRKE